MNKGELNHKFFRTKQMHQKITFDKLMKYGIAPGQPNVLRFLMCNNGCIQNQLAVDCNLEPATITSMLNRMEKAHLIERKSDAADKRVSTVWITQTGMEMCNQVNEIFKEIEEICYGGFSEDEKEVFFGLLDRMKNNIKSELDSTKEV